MSSPRNFQEFIYIKLMKSPAFHRFVKNVYYKVNGIQPSNSHHSQQSHLGDRFFQPTAMQKFKAYRLLFYDEWRATFGFSRKY